MPGPGSELHFWLVPGPGFDDFCRCRGAGIRLFKNWLPLFGQDYIDVKIKSVMSCTTYNIVHPSTVSTTHDS